MSIALAEYPGNPAGMGIRFVRIEGVDGPAAGAGASWSCNVGGEAGGEGKVEEASPYPWLAFVSKSPVLMLTRSDAAFDIPSLTASTARSPRSAMIGFDEDEVWRRGRVRVR